MKEKVAGIYKITNLINNKLYIGSSLDLYKRGWEHFNDPYKSNPHITKAINKYGKNNLLWEIIDEYNFPDTYEKAIKVELLESREQYYMDMYECYNPDKGYNISKTAGKPSKATKESAAKSLAKKRAKGLNKTTYPRLSEAKLGYLNPMYGRRGANHPTSKKLYAYNLDGTFLKEFNCHQDAIEQLNLTVNNIVFKSKNSGTGSSCGGYIFLKEYQEKTSPYKKLLKNNNEKI